MSSYDRSPTGSGPLPWLAFLIALVATAGTLYLTLGMGLKACPFCLYQRTFVFGVVGILLVGLLAGARPGFVSLLTLPLAAAALAVAGFHVYKEAIGDLECPTGLMGIGSAPQQALAVLVLLAVVLILDVLAVGKDFGLIAVVGTVVLGVLFAVGVIITTPKGGPDYLVPVNQDMCRPPKTK